MLHSFGWIFFLLIGLTVVGLAVYLEIGRRRRAAEERKAVWKAHQDWLNSSLPTPPPSRAPAPAASGVADRPRG